MSTKTIQIGARTETATLPKILLCYEVASLASVSGHRAALAALALCTRVGRAAKIDAAAYKGDLSRLAEDLADRLGDVGLTYPQAVMAGAECLALITASIVGESEVKKAEGNSETATEDSP